jgi:chromosome segregation ATPase
MELLDMRAIFTGLFVSFFMFLSACTDEINQISSSATSGPKGKTSAELSLEKQAKSLTEVSRNIVVRNTIEGAAAGALAGCLIAELTGGDCAQGAILGGVAGGVGGNAVGKKAANVNKELVNQRQVIASLSGINKKLAGVQSSLRRVVSAQNTEIGSLKRQLNNKQISKSQYSSRLRAINSNRRNVSASLQRPEANVAKSRKTLVSLEKQGGKSLSSSKKAAASTQNRLANLRKSVSLVKTN